MFNNLEFKTNQNSLNQEELKKVSSFILYLLKNSQNTKIIFRGENYINLKEKFKLFGDSDYSKLNHFLFLIGEKGRTYRESYRKEIVDKKKVYAIDCIIDEFFKNIFIKIHEVLKRIDKPQIVSFNNENKEFCIYFSELANKPGFIEKIKSFSSKEDKIEIRDYYLNLLHQIGKIGFYNNSFFSSTTTDYRIAVDFAQTHTSPQKIIFVSWVKYPQCKIGMSYNYLNRVKKLILKTQLPLYNNSFFPKQKELSIKGGLLPHYILGYIKLNNNEFEINPNFFSTLKGFKEILEEGFDIDQSQFLKTIKKTDYKGFFVLDNDGNYYDYNE